MENILYYLDCNESYIHNNNKKEKRQQFCKEEKYFLKCDMIVYLKRGGFSCSWVNEKI
jgi:hypothetical protein